jgi:hypothetical protein
MHSPRLVFKILAFTLVFSFMVMDCNAEQSSPDFQVESTRKQQNQTLFLTTMVGVGVITAWGVAEWDYFSQSPHSDSEGWFSNGTKYGGADKFGHMYVSYVTSHGLSYLYERWAFKKEKAALYGALSSLLIYGYMEIGDSFSEHGFSYEDLIANALGSAFGYFSYRSPGLADKIDFRWEYGFDANGSDFTTDYENTKYLFALKLNGFESMQNSILKHFEILLGYYTRGFSVENESKERNIFVGVGLNLTDIFRRHSYDKTATLLRYIQIPYTYIEYAHDLKE